METGCQNIVLCSTILKVAFPIEVVGPLYLFPGVYFVFQFFEAAMIIMLFWCYQRFKRKEKGKSDSRFQRLHFTTGLLLHTIKKNQEFTDVWLIIISQKFNCELIKCGLTH